MAIPTEDEMNTVINAVDAVPGSTIETGVIYPARSRIATETYESVSLAKKLTITRNWAYDIDADTPKWGTGAGSTPSMEDI